KIGIASGFVLSDQMGDPLELRIAVRGVTTGEVFGNLAQPQVLLLHPVPNHIGTNWRSHFCHGGRQPGRRQIGKHDGRVVGIACRPHLQHRLQVLFKGRVGQDFFFDRHRGDAPVRPRGHGATHRVRQAHVRSFAASPPRPRQCIARYHSLAAALAPPQSAGGLFRIGFDKNPGQSFRPTHPMASSMPPPSLVSRNMIHPQIDRRDTFLTKNMKEYDTNLSSNTYLGDESTWLLDAVARGPPLTAWHWTSGKTALAVSRGSRRATVSASSLRSRL